MSGRRDLASILEDIASELRRANDLAEERMRDSAKDVLYTPSEAAEYMGKTIRTLENYVSKGFLHKVIRGGRRGYVRDGQGDRMLTERQGGGDAPLHSSNTTTFAGEALITFPPPPFFTDNQKNRWI